MKIFVLVYCILIQTLLISTKILPKTFPEFCSKSEPKYNKCMERELRKMGPYLLKGIESINFPSLQPFSISFISFEIPLIKDVSFQSKLKNLEFSGYNNMELKKFEFDPTALTGRVFLYMPQFHIKFEYDASATLRNFKLGNVGYLTANVSEIDLEFYFELKKINKMGIDYLTLDKFEAKGAVQNVHIRPVSIDPEQQLIGDIFASVFNEFSKEIMQFATALHDEVLTLSYASLIGKFLFVVPANEIIPN